MGLASRLMVLAAGLIGLGASPVSAQPMPVVPTGAKVTLQQTAGRDLDQDRISAQLRVENEAVSPAEVQDAINRGMARALEKARAVASVDAETAGYSLYRDTERGVWRGSQELVLDSADAPAVLDLVGALQAEGFVSSQIGYYLSREARERVTDELIVEALAGANGRLEVMSGAVDSKGFAIEAIDLSPQAEIYPRMRAARAEAMTADAYAPPVAEAGTTRVEVSLTVTARLFP
ncbi:SIMPL domain-containing protein [Marinivivus vitaminiproducens]|uniref:SIMPL domain-containing protein n=1 Tax=Marinivivus vitaminiproducens TaxID=3035935 RepID=UPI00279B1B50|nr:SIMPL domain-containing protein [Geminicoccaceae bacterium SCSIO 64248]